MATAYRNAVVNGRQSGLHYLSLNLLLALLCAWSAACGAAGSRFDSGLLWKIERPGVAASWLFGTIHSDDPAVTRLPAPVQEAFDSAATVILEVTLDADNLHALTAHLLMTPEESLESVLGATLYRRAAAAMHAQGVPEPVVARMKPWAVAVTLMMPPARSGVILDQLLYEDAVAARKQVQGLETVAEQMALFDDMPQREQIALLEDTLDHLAEIERELTALVQAWLDRDLARLMAINERYMQYGDAQLAESINQRVIVDRNRGMVERMQRFLDEGRCFVAVGALHLPGPEGLLRLLEKRGYTVSRVY